MKNNDEELRLAFIEIDERYRDKSGENGVPSDYLYGYANALHEVINILNRHFPNILKEQSK